jgi:hypothetical protein
MIEPEKTFENIIKFFAIIIVAFSALAFIPNEKQKVTSSLKMTFDS